MSALIFLYLKQIKKVKNVTTEAYTPDYGNNVKENHTRTQPIHWMKYNPQQLDTRPFGGLPSGLNSDQ